MNRVWTLPEETACESATQLGWRLQSFHEYLCVQFHPGCTIGCQVGKRDVLHALCVSMGTGKRPKSSALHLSAKSNRTGWFSKSIIFKSAADRVTNGTALDRERLCVTALCERADAGRRKTREDKRAREAMNDKGTFRQTRQE